MWIPLLSGKLGGFGLPSVLSDFVSGSSFCPLSWSPGLTSRAPACLGLLGFRDSASLSPGVGRR